jgi:hypothetical protein
MRTDRLAAFAAAMILAAGCGNASPQKPPPKPQQAPSSADCTLTHPSHDVLSLKKLPPNILAALTKMAGGMADRGEFFNTGDAVTTPGPFNRFIRAGETQGGWYIWYEHGGIAYWHQIVLFLVDPSGTVHTVASEISHNANLCEATDALLDGKPHQP